MCREGPCWKVLYLKFGGTLYLVHLSTCVAWAPVGLCYNYLEFGGILYLAHLSTCSYGTVLYFYTYLIHVELAHKNLKQEWARDLYLFIALVLLIL